MAKEKLEDEYPVSDKDMVQQAIKQHEEKEVRDYKFPTEVIDLPSKGLIYSKDNPLSSGKVEMKYMTAKEEDILTSTNLIEKGLVIDKLLSSVIADPKIKLDDLLIGDKNALMLGTRVLGYGPKYDVIVNDPDTGLEVEHTFDLTKLETKNVDEKLFESGENKFEFKLPNSKHLSSIYISAIIFGLYPDIFLEFVVPAMRF